jgi:hypothetical protein
MSPDVRAHLVIAVISVVLSIIGAFVAGRLGAGSVLRAARTAGVVADRARSAREEQAHRAMFEELAHELHLNAAQAKVPRLDEVWMPFHHDALRQAEPYFALLPGYARHAIQRASRAMARYNTLAAYTNQRSLDQPPDKLMRLDSSVHAVAQDAQAIILRAAQELEGVLTARWH